MINHPELSAALTSDYLNVYVADIEKDEASVVKMKGYTLDKIKESPASFPYWAMVKEYIETRVHPDDGAGLRNVLDPATLKRTFQDGKMKIEVKYRVLIDAKPHFFSVVCIRLSKPSDPLRLLVGFRNVDDIINMERTKRQEGLFKAYQAVSELYLCMYRVNLKTEEFKVIKDNAMANQFINSNKFSDNSANVLRALTTPETEESMRAFLDLSTLQERMKGKNRVSIIFVSSPSNLKFRLSFIREDNDEEGRLLHALYAVEALESDKYESAFDVLSREFTNVFRLNLSSGIATILKQEGYVATNCDPTHSPDFPWDKVLAQYLKERVAPKERKALYQKLCVASLKATFDKEKSFSGYYKVSLTDTPKNYRYDCYLTSQKGTILIGFRDADALLKEHLEQERKEKEKEEAHKKELEEQLAIFNNLSKNYRNIYLGNLENGTAKILKLDGDYGMQELQALREKIFPFEPVIETWAKQRVHPDDLPFVLKSLSIENLRKKLGESEEYSGTYRSFENGKTVNYRFLVSRIDGFSRVICGFQVIDDIIEQHMKEEKEKRAREEALQKEVNERNDLISALATLYSTIFNVDIPAHRYEILTSVSLMSEAAPKQGVFDLVREKVLNSFMAEDCKQEMRDFLDLNTLSERLSSANTILREYRNPKGAWFEARFIVKKRDEKGKAVQALYVAREVTSEKEQELRQEAALRDALSLANHASRAKTTFLNSMSHDIRTPMNAIIGFTALAEAHLENKDAVKEYLGKIHTSSSHLLSLINEILDMSRIESGAVKLDESLVHLPSVLHDLRTMIQGQVTAKRQRLYIDAIDVWHEEVYTDKLRLNQVLLNIAGNAIKYTKEGGEILIKVEERRCSKEGKATYRFSVKDNGIGMSPEFKSKIFEAFARERSTTISGIQGTGLGMSITKSIVDLMNGTIEVESEQGKGSEFTVTVDFRLGEKQTPHDPIPALEGARVLVVDDDLLSCQSVCALLREIKMRAEWTSSGKEAIIRAKEASDLKDEYKVYIIDYLMPDLNGIETVKEIRKVIGEEVPMIILTAYDWSEIEEEAREAGVTAFLSKPVFLSDLRRALAKDESDKAEEEEETDLDCRGKRVLLVEDNGLNREIATSILTDMGFEVDEATDGIEAVNVLAKAESDRYSLVFMDIQMPRMDGYTATREIRTFKDNRKANIPILAMTANAFEEDKIKSFEAGMNGHIAKPIDRSAIAKAIAPFLEK